METAITVIAALVIGGLIGVLIGTLMVGRRLHRESTGLLVFDRSDPALAPYLCFESHDELTAIRKKRYVTLAVKLEGNSQK